MGLKSSASAPLNVTRVKRILKSVEFARPIILPRSQDWKDPEVKGSNPTRVSYFAITVDCLNRNIGVGSQRLIPRVEPIAGQFVPISQAYFAKNTLVNLGELLLTTG